MSTETDTEKVPRMTVKQSGPRGFVCPDFHVIHPRTKEKQYPPDTMGTEVGNWLADLYDRAAEDVPNLPQRCSTCAYRRGTNANNSGQTVADALECVGSRGTFYCHHGERHFDNEHHNVCEGHRAVELSVVGVWLREQYQNGKLPKWKPEKE